MIISVNTKLIPLLGMPLGQSFAPRMQNETYRALGLDYLYFPLEVENDHLEDIVKALRVMNCPGFAVTKPNKIKVMEYLDELDPLAEKMGAVNTVVKKDGKLIGYNTDGEGFVRSLIHETGLKLEETRFFSFGAGGAGRAVCMALAHYGAKEVTVCDIDNTACQSLTEDINTKCGPVGYYVDGTDEEALKKAVSSADVVMNNSGLGMYPNTQATPVDKSFLHKGQIAFDAIYNPLKTQFLKDAEEQGCRVINGLGMSIYQGAIQVNLWTGKPEPIELMTTSIQQIVQEMQK